MPKIKNCNCELKYWDENNKNLYPWYKKGKTKKVLRKKWIKKQINFET